MFSLADLAEQPRHRVSHGNFKRVGGDLDATLDLYFQLSSTTVSTVQLATMAATLSSGGFMAIAPGLLGVGVLSPRLNSGGNSIRGIHVCEDLAKALNLHVFRNAKGGQASGTR